MSLSEPCCGRARRSQMWCWSLRQEQEQQPNPELQEWLMVDGRTPKPLLEKQQ
jgi:hypothetical protein